MEKNWLAVSKLTWEICQILTRALERHINFHFNWFLLSKVYILFELKKFGEVFFHDTEDWCKTWGQIDLSFQNWHEEFVIFWSGPLESLTIFTIMVSFLSKLYIVCSTKVQRSNLSWHWRLMENMERNWLVISKLTWGIYQILTWSTQESQKFLL